MENFYVVMPCGFERIDSTRQIGKVRVISMNRFTRKLEFKETERTIISKVALAFLETAAPYNCLVRFRTTLRLCGNGSRNPKFSISTMLTRYARLLSVLRKKRISFLRATVSKRFFSNSNRLPITV